MQNAQAPNDDYAEYVFDEENEVNVKTEKTIQEPTKGGYV